jgi:hypothetical protein
LHGRRRFHAQEAQANDLIVRYDQSQLIRLPRPATEVIIGNPSIADVAIQGGNLLVVTGKMFGVTNIIALDAQRNVIQDQRVIVERDDQRTLVLYKGALRESYSCTPNCSPTMTIGDDTAYFETIAKHSQSKNAAGCRAGRPRRIAAVRPCKAAGPRPRAFTEFLNKLKPSFTENAIADMQYNSET